MKLHFWLVFLAMGFLQSCATSQQGTVQQISFTSNPPGATGLDARLLRAK